MEIQKYTTTSINWSGGVKMADVIQFWEMEMSTHRGAWKHGHELRNEKNYSE